jgi:hypothetical protein
MSDSEGGESVITNEHDDSDPENNQFASQNEIINVQAE